MKLGLQKTVNRVYEMIKNGDDFIVNEYKTGIITKILYKNKDIDPHVCDFQKAGVDDLDIAYYFAYIIARPEYEVVSIKQNEVLETNERLKFSDHIIMGKLEKVILDKALKCKVERLNAEKEEQSL